MEPEPARIRVNPDVLRWAIGYAGREEHLRAKFGDAMDQWASGEIHPTWFEIDDFAKEARVPFAYMYGHHVPDLSIEDLPPMRTLGDAGVDRPSPGLTATIRSCFIRRDWHNDYAERSGHPLRDFVGSCTIRDDPAEVAAKIKAALGWTRDLAIDLTERNYRDKLAELAEKAGTLVMVSKAVGGDTDWRLDPEEFRGFSLIDEYAPLVFINGNDSLPAQAFTLAHELAHIWSGQGGVSAPDAIEESSDPVETWCNRVADELLVPTPRLTEIVGPGMDAIACLPELQRRFSLSRLVMLRRLRHAKLIELADFNERYPRELDASRHPVKRHRNPPARRPVPPTAGVQQPTLFEVDGTMDGNAPTCENHGPATLPIAIREVGLRFATAVYRDAKLGGTLFNEVYKLLGGAKRKDLNALARIDEAFA